MDKLAAYIFNHCPELLTAEERRAHKNIIVQQKIEATAHEMQREMMREKWLSYDNEILELLRNGAEEFYKVAVERVFRDHPKKEYLNLCPKCRVLVRTREAKQCPECFYSWRGELEK